MLDDLKARYRKGLPAKIESLELGKQALMAKTSDAATSVRRQAHALRGSGGTYGFPEVSEAAAAVEGALSDEDLAARLDLLLNLLRTIASVEWDKKETLLIVDDDPDIREVIQATLMAPHRELVLAATVKEAEALFIDRSYHLVVLDLLLPDGDGRNLLMKLRERPATASVPIIVLSAHTAAASKAECFALGADAFFEKPFDPAVFKAAVASALQRGAEAERQARQDLLTGLPNRAAYHEAFGQFQSFASRMKQPLAIAAVDLDHFKSVNDTYGHLMGDEVLRRAARVIRTALRQSDMIARWGGEEFAVLFPNTPVEGAKQALEKALEALRLERFESGGHSFFISFSAGVTVVTERMSEEDAMSAADRLLYLAKKSGRARVVSSGESVELPKAIMLLAEDDDLTASLVKDRVEREGWSLHHCRDGRSAVEFMKHHPVSLMILDVQMPEMSGFEVLAWVRAMPHLKKIPIIMLTSLGMEKDVVRGMNGGANDYVLKPFSVQELLARIRRHLTSAST